MNAGSIKYKDTLVALQKIDGEISAYSEFFGRLVGGNAKNISISLRMDKEKVEEVVVEEDDPMSMLSMMRLNFYSGLTKTEPTTIDTPHHTLNEKLAIQLCKMVIEELTQERTRLLGVLGLLVNTHK